MRSERRKKGLVLALAAVASLAGPVRGAAEGGRPVLETIRTDDGPRILFAGVGVGTKYERAAERLGGDPMGAFFGRPFSFTKEVRLEGVPCDLLVEIAEGRVSSMMLWCEGTRPALEALAAGIEATFEGIPTLVGEQSIAWTHGEDIVAVLQGSTEGEVYVLSLTIRG